jgi:hypothetical protein
MKEKAHVLKALKNFLRIKVGFEFKGMLRSKFKGKGGARSNVICIC